MSLAGAPVQVPAPLQAMHARLQVVKAMSALSTLVNYGTGYGGHGTIDGQPTSESEFSVLHAQLPFREVLGDAEGAWINSSSIELHDTVTYCDPSFDSAAYIASADPVDPAAAADLKVGPPSVLKLHHSCLRTQATVACAQLGGEVSPTTQIRAGPVSGFGAQVELAVHLVRISLTTCSLRVRVAHKSPQRNTPGGVTCQ